MHAPFQGALDRAYAFFYIVNKACKPEYGLQASIKIYHGKQFTENISHRL